MRELHALCDPAVGELPTVFKSPFSEDAPALVARSAATSLLNELVRGRVAGVSMAELEAPLGGKMFGVLVVRTRGGELGVLRAFSGMLGGRFALDGFVPPLFDLAARAELEVPGEARVSALTALHAALEQDEELQRQRAALELLVATHAQERAALKSLHMERRATRHAARTGPGADMAALARESRHDAAEARRLEQRQELERKEVGAPVAERARKVEAVHRLRRRVSSALWRALCDTIVLPSFAGERQTLRAVFAPRDPPGGAGECAAPKLLGFAAHHGLEPLALAEVYVGAPPLTGGRVHGAFYPACRGKCGPVLAFMLRGLTVDASPAPEPTTPLAPRIVHEDEDLWVVEKPAGLQSVPGRSPRASVWSHLAQRHAQALMVHRLDRDVSGLLVVAKNAETHVALQRQFASRAVDKRYVAVLAGQVKGERGCVDLKLRPDFLDRPRQIYDPLNGKQARTEWEVLARTPTQTRVALVPVTGRTHQLRLHAAHPLGLAAAIVGDSLYGTPGERLLLHAERLTFTHPVSGQSLRFSSDAPF